MYDARPDDPMVLLFAGEIIIRNNDPQKAQEVFTKVTKICKPGSREHEQVSLLHLLLIIIIDHSYKALFSNKS